MSTEGAKPTDVTFGKLVNVSDKVRRRMYDKAMKDLQNIQCRSKETLDRLNFTVDLVSLALLLLSKRRVADPVFQKL